MPKSKFKGPVRPYVDKRWTAYPARYRFRGHSLSHFDDTDIIDDYVLQHAPVRRYLEGTAAHAYGVIGARTFLPAPGIIALSVMNGTVVHH